MAYTPTTWATGDVITADKLNNMENGILNAGSGGGGGGVVTYTFTIKEGEVVQGRQMYDVVETDATPQSVLESIESGKFCLIKYREQWYDDDSGETIYGDWLFGYFDEVDVYGNRVYGGKNFYLGGFSMNFQGNVNEGTWIVSKQTPQS